MRAHCTAVAFGCLGLASLTACKTTEQSASRPSSPPALETVALTSEAQQTLPSGTFVGRWSRAGHSGPMTVRFAGPDLMVFSIRSNGKTYEFSATRQDGNRFASLDGKRIDAVSLEGEAVVGSYMFGNIPGSYRLVPQT